MSTSRDFHHGDLKAALTRSAASMIERIGSAALSLREVAREAGVSSAAPYRHFASREALLAEVARQGFERLHAELARAGMGADIHPAFLSQCVTYIRFAERQPALYRLMFGAFPDKHRFAGLVEAGDRLFALLDGATGLAPDRRARAVGCWAMVHGLAMLVLDDQLRTHLPGMDDDSLLAVIRPFAQTLMAGR